jgi:hypothetical protein
LPSQQNQCLFPQENHTHLSQ